ncbi:MAG: methionyl-tRNA formyltransferase [Desulfobacteraceae bacterium]
MPEAKPNANAAPSIVYMGTPDFAVPTLHALHHSPFDLRWVVTQPDRPKGRGRQLAAPPVKKAALQLGYDVSQPENVRHKSFLEALRRRAPDYLVVVAFGQILPISILEIPLRGAINVHASLLPKYRGPAPIQWAIMRGETTTGVTTMLMDQGVDTGDMLLDASTPISEVDTAASLHDRLAIMGADLLVETIEAYHRGKIYPRSQKHQFATYAPILKKEDGRIQWHKSALAIDAQIRAMTPWPGAFCTMCEKRYKIHKARAMADAPTTSAPGTVVPGFPDELRIATGQGQLAILEIQSASGKRLSIEKFLNGTCIAPGEIAS